MKKIFAIISLMLALSLALGCAAAEEAAGEALPSISSGAVARDGEGALWFSMGGALNRLTPDGRQERIVEGDARCIQYSGGAVYYVLREPDESDPYGEDAFETLWRIGEDAVPVQIGEARRVEVIREYSEDYTGLVNGTSFVGYTDMTVLDDSIYFIGTDDVSGSYVTDARAWEMGMPEVSYKGSCAVYRMNTDGSGLEKIISGLGNGQARMDIAGGRIAVASCFLNPVYAYDFTNFMLYDLEGRHIKTFANEGEDRHSWLFKEEEEFTAIVCGVQTDGETIYASLGDSEGDFASSRLVNVESASNPLVIEAFYAPALVTEDGLYYVTADVEDTFWVDGMEYTTAVYFRDNSGSESLLAHVPHDYIGFDMHLALHGDVLYLSSRHLAFSDADYEEAVNSGVLLRINLQSAAVDELTEAGFSVSMACDPEFYTPPVLAWSAQDSEPEEDYFDGAFLLPDSDVYLYSEDELSIYDAETLALMRNEILARHGYVFKTDAYREYFSAQSWYEENPDFVYDNLNAVEMENVELIKKLEGR